MTGWGSAFAGLPFGEPSPGVLDGVLARIAAGDGDLSAFVAIDADRAPPCRGGGRLANYVSEGGLHPNPNAS